MQADPDGSLARAMANSGRDDRIAKLERQVQTPSRPTDHAPALAEALRECMTELKELVEDRYKGTLDSRQYERDIGPVQRAREALRRYEGE